MRFLVDSSNKSASQTRPFFSLCGAEIRLDSTDKVTRSQRNFKCCPRSFLLRRALITPAVLSASRLRPSLADPLRFLNRGVEVGFLRGSTSLLPVVLCGIFPSCVRWYRVEVATFQDDAARSALRFPAEPPEDVQPPPRAGKHMYNRLIQLSASRRSRDEKFSNCRFLFCSVAQWSLRAKSSDNDPGPDHRLSLGLFAYDEYPRNSG